MQENRFAAAFKQNAIWLVFFIEIAIFAYFNPKFLSIPNIVNISRQVSYYGIASIGMTFVILIAGIDLSIASIVVLVNVVCASLMMKFGWNMWLAILISIVMATLIGVLNGFMVATIGIPAIIATFASQTVFRGLAYILSGGLPIPDVLRYAPEVGLNGNPTLSFFARWSLNHWSIFPRTGVGLIPICAIIMVICFAVGSFILNKSYFGRYFYAIGGNEEASELSGIRVNKMKYLIYALSGFFAGLAGVIVLSRTGSAQASSLVGFEFEVITCVVLGGVSVAGGIGRMSGVIAGVLIIGSLKCGMVMANVSEYTQMVVQGLVLAVAVGFDCFSKKRQKN
ncbi:MAG: ABC transporter permease [Synergistaceae bacterium]|nr:ABC transporter permease [Synergistaceae bacterium]